MPAGHEFQREFREEVLSARERARSRPFVLAILLALLAWSNRTMAQASPASGQQGAQTPPQFGTISPYLGLPIDEIEFPGVPPEQAPSLLAASTLKIGDPLTRENLHDAMQALFATGRFYDIQAEADPTDTAGVRLRFLTTANFFVGIVTIQGISSNPSANQLASATRLQLGELYTRDKLSHALEGIQRMMEENGFHQSRTTSSEERDEQQHQINLTFHVIPGRRCRVSARTDQRDCPPEIWRPGICQPHYPRLATYPQAVPEAESSAGPGRSRKPHLSFRAQHS
jgi:outer membrane protein assembly factor BamA